MRPETERFPEGVIREGCEHLRALLSRVPLVEDFSWTASDFRFWSVRFAIRCEGPLAWGVVRRLAYALNTSVPEYWQCRPFVFGPDGDESTHGSLPGTLYWSIDSVEPLVDPREVGQHLEMVLLSRVNVESDWLEY
jgi:hypothetical protein